MFADMRTSLTTEAIMKKMPDVRIVEEPKWLKDPALSGRVPFRIKRPRFGESKSQKKEKGNGESKSPQRPSSACANTRWRRGTRSLTCRRPQKWKALSTEPKVGMSEMELSLFVENVTKVSLKQACGSEGVIFFSQKSKLFEHVCDYQVSGRSHARVLLADQTTVTFAGA